MAESEKELMSFLIRVKEESEKAGLKLNSWKTNITALSPIISWQINWEKVEAVTDFTFLDSKITADSNCGRETKRCLLTGRKVMTKLDTIWKSRDIILLTKVHMVKAMVFPVVMYGCESWTQRRMNTRELVLLNCGAGEDSWESLGQQGDQTSQS